MNSNQDDENDKNNRFVLEKNIAKYRENDNLIKKEEVYSISVPRNNQYIKIVR